MKDDIIYHYTRSRKDQSRIFINMGVLSLIYIAGIYGYEQYLDKTVEEQTRYILIAAFLSSSAITFCIAWWLRTHPALYEVRITKERFIIKYPESKQWSFDIAVSEIKRFEHRNTLSHAGKGIAKSGVLLKDGSFHHVCMNYGGNINKMYKAIKEIRPEVTFPKGINKRISGPFEKEYDK